MKKLVLNSVSSPHSKRGYEQALDAFERWCAATGAARFTKSTVQAYRATLEAAGLGASSIDIRLSRTSARRHHLLADGNVPPEMLQALVATEQRREDGGVGH